MSTEQADAPPSESGDAVDGGDAAASEAGDADATESGPRVAKDEYSWEDFKEEYYYDEDGNPPRDGEGNVVEFDASEYLGFDPKVTENVLAGGEELADRLDAHARAVRLAFEAQIGKIQFKSDGNPGSDA